MSSQRRINLAMRRFAEIVDDLGLVDLPLQGGEFTWNGGHNNQAWARLDRFLKSPSWLDQFSGVTQSRLSRPISDHFPIILVGGGIRRGLTPFKFENMWLKVEGFKDLIRSWWRRIEVRVSASFRLAAKMKEIKKKLKVWNREVFGRLDCNKSSALQQVDFWDRVESKRSLTVEETELKKEAKESYKKRYGVEGGYGRLQLDQINQQEAENMEIPFTEIEVHTALMEMNGDKAPGPNGFTVAFWQSCWDFAKEEILDMFKEFREHNSFLKSLNNTFLVLIPKKSGVEDLGDFRPISLLGGLYKLLAKVLANMLKKVVGKVVSTTQNAFVMGRQILDAFLIANEVIDSWQKRKEKGLICKLDIEKAYDSINWKFLLKVLQKMGFGAKWLGWMWSCLSSAKFSILVNGVPTGFFPSTKGLDKEIPYLTYLLWKWKCWMFSLGELWRGDSYQGVAFGKEHLTHLSWILLWFEATSDLRINLAKSEIIPVGEVEEIEEMTVELGCRVGSLPSQYLRLPLGAPNRAPSIWDGVEERVRRRLALWKR
ncbi:LINE-1 retrotransposable element ORF2 protein [Vitis vinifera]|uniref:LINE-1 retrotransposable element ORF2 protein n=1 Tax=Vitis vinifera TaxID=29760 RepID=A0A438D9H6_VITVI|nr:LINE-1 retrotransposable element ORF2 protein [Vitis vinifera]